MTPYGPFGPERDPKYDDSGTRIPLLVMAFLLPLKLPGAIFFFVQKLIADRLEQINRGKPFSQN